ncbi:MULTISPECIES: hypothetical protein [Blautia]|uniref:Uncharacterized protein n=1 Tax=Blautia massiliensis (ex Durand et al. 2017) TaxID=1737424 RepID=A0ABW9X6L5_9FIRM|nr:MULTISPECIES: hypothetical protein [Blautia]MZL72154.1 hypothetical protein [Blautia massiliensis (ex Durand et al. 2017)]MZL78632.1 hypothetical protein [Blautia massiliensis (ex Durand et al. 2017)]RYT34115.1 hypothetical protein EAI83_14820 [Blautia sp. aa_0143]
MKIGKIHVFGKKNSLFGKELFVFGKYISLFFKMYFSFWGRKSSYFSGIKNASAILKRMRFSGTEQGILGSDVLFLGKEKHYAEKELQAKQ